jgi:hypothetical protein
MHRYKALRGFRLSTFLLAGLSLSIGWGIRGNFGHEAGAMIPGALAAIAVCLLSGREDWRRRVPYFAMFGAIGWAFGGSISYMQVIGYTHSGHEISQWYGFAGLFVIGFLWGGMGGAGTAFPAVADRERMTALFRPLCWVLAAFIAFYFLYDSVIEGWVASFTPTWHRHESPLYWFDADWLQAAMVLAAIFLFDLWDRRFARAYWLPVFAALGAGLGYLVQAGIRWIGQGDRLWTLLVQRQGDIDYLVQTEGITREAATESLVVNWPQIILHIPEHIGWIIGLIIGICLYFCVLGKFRDGASLFVYMAGGWLVSFLIFPTLLGIRMTPPRGDDWAGILGLFLGAMLWLHRNNLRPVALAGVISGVVGGLGFSGMQCLKLFMVYPGNREVFTDPDILARWQHWQSANWHSFLEQSYGFVNGLGIALALAIVARMTGPVSEQCERPRRWTSVFAAGFVLFVVTFLNIFKNPQMWKGLELPGGRAFIQDPMRAPWFPSIELSVTAWFIVTWLVIMAAVVALMVRHQRRPIALVSRDPVGKGQLLFLAFLWLMVIANWERALYGFSEGRLITEWVITIDAVLATLLVCLMPRGGVLVPPLTATTPVRRWPGDIARAVVAGALVVAIGLGSTYGMTRAVRALYGDRFIGHAALHTRFGPDAGWITKPLRRGEAHK